RETFVHVGPEDGVGAVADFRIRVEQAERGVCFGYAGAAGAVVGEQELPVLVVRASRAGLDVDFIVVVFTRALESETKLEGVIVLDPGEAVRNRVNRSGGVRRIGSSAESRERGHVDRRDTFRNELAIGKDIRVVEVARNGHTGTGIGLVEKVRSID